MILQKGAARAKNAFIEL